MPFHDTTRNVAVPTMESLTKIVVTPAMAADWLNRCNDQNYRKLNQSLVKRYATDMKAGRWTRTPATISFSITGKLVDGQHRLSAVVLSGCNIEFYVLRGLPDEMIHDPNTDKGKVRDAATHLAFLGIRNGNTVASSIRAICRLARSKSVRGSGGVTDAAIVAVAAEIDQKFFDKVNWVCGKSSVRALAPGSIWVAFYWLAAHESEFAADRFMGIVARDIEETSTHPANSLREQLQVLRDDKRKGETRQDYVANLIFSAFKSHMAAKQVRFIRACASMPLTPIMEKACDEVALLAGV